MLNTVVCADLISSTLLTLDSASHKNQISPLAKVSPPLIHRTKKKNERNKNMDRSGYRYKKS